MTTDKIGKGDVVYIDIDSWILNPDGTKKLHDTTHEELAKKEKIHDEKKAYGEVPAIIGHDRLPKGLDENLMGKSVGEEGEVVVPPEKGAGQRDPKLVELYSIREFLRKDIEPEIGMPVVLGGRVGHISAITAGRVRVDFNHPLAGRTLQYSYKIVRKANASDEKVMGLLEMEYGLSDQFKIDVKDDIAEIVVPDLCKTDERWSVAKFRVVADLRELGSIKRIRFVEEYEKKEEKKAEVKPEEKPAEIPREEKKAEAKPEEKPAESPKEEKKPSRGHKKAQKAEEELPVEEKTPEEL